MLDDAAYRTCPKLGVVAFLADPFNCSGRIVKLNAIDLQEAAVLSSWMRTISSISLRPSGVKTMVSSIRLRNSGRIVFFRRPSTSSRVSSIAACSPPAGRRRDAHG